jgi:hypothetical protein
MLRDVTRWREAEAHAKDLRSGPSTSLRAHAARELGAVAWPGGCFLRFRGRGSGDFHYGAYSRDAYAFSVATTVLCEALLTDASAAVHESALRALQHLSPVGDETVKHALVAFMASQFDPTRTELLNAAKTVLIGIGSHRDLELVARLATILEAGGWEKGAWTKAKYEELCFMLPPPGKHTILPRRLRRLLADFGDPLYSGRTLPVVLPSSEENYARGDTGLRTVAIPALPDAPAGSLEGSMLLLSTRREVARGGGAASVGASDLLEERNAALREGRPGGGFLGARDGEVSSGQLDTEGRVVSLDSVVHMLGLHLTCRGRRWADKLNPKQGARRWNPHVSLLSVTCRY